MQVPICSLIAWLTIALFSFIPKKLTIIQFVFLYCVTLILTTTAYTIFDANLQIVTIPRNTTSSVSTIISRLITVPLLIMAIINALQTKRFTLSRIMALVLWMVLSGFDWLLNQIHVIAYHDWNVCYASMNYLAFIAIAWSFMRWFKKFDEGTV